MTGTTDTTDPFEIEIVDVDGVPTRVFRHAPRSMREVWLASVAFGDATYLVYDDERWSYAETHDRVARLADRWVTVDGIRRGDRIAIACRNYPEWVVACWAALGIGAVIVPLNAWWSGPELAFGLEHSGASVLVADVERLDRLDGLLDATAVRSVLSVRTDRHVEWAGGRSERLEDVTSAEGDPPTFPEVTVEPDHDATVMYTSGTTGTPKGALGTHRNLTAFLMNLHHRLATAAAAAPAATPAESAAPPPAPVTLLTFPLFHVGGLQSFLVTYTASGGTIVLMYKWDVHRAIDHIERERVTALAAVPTTLYELLDVAMTEGRDLSSLAGISSGATQVPPELVRRIDAQLDHRTAPGNGYGLTETSGAAISNAGADYLTRPDSVGRPISPVMEVRIADPVTGEELDTGEVGEIWLKGPTVVRGYFRDLAATAASFTDGWFHTGDLGRLDADGFLTIVDRMKDVVIRGGENVYAAEVEAAVFEHPDVTEVAVIGVPHERLGEEVGAAVRVRPGSTVTAEDLRTHVAGRLAAFKVPAYVWILDEDLPKNATGKVLKRDLRERLVPTVAP